MSVLRRILILAEEADSMAGRVGEDLVEDGDYLQVEVSFKRSSQHS